MAVSGQLPQPGARVEVGEWAFEVVTLEGRRIDHVRAVKARTA
jgi:CBS domain containing-hemolysin-like protein